MCGYRQSAPCWITEHSWCYSAETKPWDHSLRHPVRHFHVHQPRSFPLNVKALAVSLTAKRNFDFYNKNCLRCFVPMNSCVCIARKLLQLHCKCKCLPDTSCTFSKVESQKYSPENSVLFLVYGCTFFFGYVKESL